MTETGPEPRPLEELQERLEVRFRDLELLQTSLTHRSFAHEAGERGVHNETLEFLGDSLLGFLVAEMIYEVEDLVDEGSMTRVRALLVCEEALAALARSLNLGSYLRMSHGEEKTGGRDKPSILSDAFEAVLAAIYLDQGIDDARRLVRREMEQRLPEAYEPDQLQDPKSALQEQCHRQGLPLPRYRMVDTTGPDHRPVYEVQCQIGDQLATEGRGPSKKSAEREAARRALTELEKLS